MGKHLCTQIDGVFTSGMIVETEAYRAPEDKASHAYNNRRTARTETMFKQGGICYIYLCYGIHHLFNIVTGGTGTAHAVLIRAVEPVAGIEHMLKRRKMNTPSRWLSGGPGLLTRALGINKNHNAISVSKSPTIWIEGRGSTIPSNMILASPRVGVDYAEECAEWPWRFRIKDNLWCSPAS